MATTTVFRAQESLAQGEVTGIAQGVATTVGPASYATGGFALDLVTDESLPAQPFECHIRCTDGNGVPDATYVAEWDSSNSKIVAFVRATGAEVAAAVDLSGVTFRIHWFAAKL